MLRTYIVAFLLLLITPITNAQKCEEIRKWIQGAADEFPGVDFSKVRSYDLPYNIIRYNLLTDVYFVPLAGQSYTSLTTSQKRKLGKKIEGCTQNDKTNQHRSIARFMTDLFSDENAYSTAQTNIELIERFKSSFEQSLEQLKNPESPSNLRYKATRELEVQKAHIFPSVIKQRVNALKEMDQMLDNRYYLAEVKRKTNKFILENANYEKKQIESLEKDYPHVSKENITLANSIFDKKVAQYIHESLEKDLLEINQLTGEELIESADYMISKKRQFNNKYDNSSYHPEANRALESIDQIFTNKLLTQVPIIDFFLNKVKHSVQIEHLNHIFFNRFRNPSDPRLKSLIEKKAALENKFTTIERQEQNSITKKEEQQKNNMVDLKNEIKVFERQLELSYIHPTIESLIGLLEQFHLLTYNSKGYSPKKAEVFFSELSGLRFNRVESGALSFSEEFNYQINDSHFKLSFFKEQGAENMRASLTLRFEFPSSYASNILKFYKKELTNSNSIDGKDEDYILNNNYVVFKENKVQILHIPYVSEMNLRNPIVKPFQRELTPLFNTTSIDVSGSNSIYIKFGDKRLTYKKETTIPLSGSARIPLKSNSIGASYGAVCYSYDNKQWYLIDQSKILPIPKETDKLYIKLNCDEISFVEGSVELYYNMVKF